MNWHRSLYWRIALGVVSLLAVMLVVQGVLFVWLIEQSGRSLPGQSPTRFSQMIASGVSSALERDPGMDLVHYLNEEYSQYTHPFFVVLSDGRLVTVWNVIPSATLVAATRALLERRATGPAGRGDPAQNRAAGSWEPAGGALSPEAMHAALLPVRPSPIVVNGRTVGMVVVPRRAPFTFLLLRFAPMLSVVASIVLIVGAVLTSALTFGPPRHRLQSLEMAARRVGAGDLSARALARGGDEVTAVATAFNAMAEELAARADAVAASDRTRRQLLADVSHELNTPITAMRGYLETLRMSDIPLDEDTRNRYLSIVSDETARLERLIGDLLDLARLESGGLKLSLDNIPVSQIFARVAARHERACQTAGVALTETIGEGAEMVRGDRDRLEQALQNLAANAIRYAPSGSTLRLAARLDDGEITLAVEDEGPGIAPAHIPHVFDRFYKADPSRHETSGSGLGLSIVKAIAEQHGGRMSVRSRPGRTVFEIAGLPVGHATDAGTA